MKSAPPSFRSSRPLLPLLLAAGLLASCGGGGESAADGDATPLAGLQLPAIGTAPRILASDNDTLPRLRALLKDNAPAAAAYKHVVDLKVGGTAVYGMEPWHAALMAQVQPEQQHYCAWAVEQTDAFVASEEAKIAVIAAAAQPPQVVNDEWVPPIPVVAHDSYLEVGGHVGNLALVYDWCRGSTTPEQRKRWVDYANKAVWNVWNPGAASWGGKPVPWTGWSTDNPVNNYYYSFLRATMLLGLSTFGENEMAGGWLVQFRTTKIENQLIPSFNALLRGGGSREGTGYGTAMMNLWELYDWWERATGERLATRTPHALDSLFWMLHNVAPTLDRIAPTGDHSRDRTAMLYDYHRHYLQQLVALFPGEPVAGMAKSLLEASTVPQMGQHAMSYSDFLYQRAGVAPRPLEGLATAYWAPGTGMFSTRGDWTRDAAWLNQQCGALTESHAHRDAGSFVLFRGQWLLHDANIDGKSGILQDEVFHNLVRFEDAQGQVFRQRWATQCAMQAVADNELFSYSVARTTPMYDPAAVAQSEREIVFIKPATFVVYDRAKTANQAVRPVFTLNFPGAPGLGPTTMTYGQGVASVEVHTVLPAAPQPVSRNWFALQPTNFPAGTGAHRVDLPAPAGGTDHEFLHVFSVGGTVDAVAADPANGLSGVRITLADGRTAIVRFDPAAPGGTLEIQDGNGVPVTAGALPIGVQVLPLYAQ